jgi:PAS domain S-box-containing protein
LNRTTLSERALILAPRGRDAQLAAGMLREAQIEATPCASIAMLVHELNAGAAFVVVTEEAIATADMRALSAWIADQQEWSDLPFVLLTSRGGGLERNPAATRHLDLLGNVTFLERPFHPTTLLSLARSAIRGRRRQYEARARLIALRESEERYRTLFETMDEGFCILEVLLGPDPSRTDLRIVEANPAFERHSGLSTAQDKHLRSLTPELAEHWYEVYARIVRTGVAERFEEGSAILGRWFDIYAFRVDYPEKNHVAVLSHDITAQRRTQERLRQMNETLEAEVAERSTELDRTWRLSQDLFGIADEHGYFFRTNPAWQRVLGWSHAQIAAQPFIELIHPDDRAATHAAFDRLKAGDAVFQFENRCCSHDGSYRWLSWSVTPQGGQNYCIARDVTADKNKTLELEAAQAALRQSQKMEAMGQLTGGVAHDFNNLLAPIVGSLDLLKRRGLGGEREKRLIDGAAQSAERARVLVQRLLAFARRQPLQAVPVDLGALVAGMAELIASTTGPKIQLDLDTSGTLPAAMVDPNQLEMALLNLAVNARDAMPEGGTLCISATCESVGTARDGLRPGPYIRLSVVDTGSGMDETTLARAIEPFYSTKGIGKGTGLGLSMVHGLASQLGGALRINSEVGVGTSVELWLPQASAEAATAPDNPRGLEQTTNRGHALLVDDEQLVRMSTADMLTDLGYHVVESASAEEALDLIGRSDAFDLLVTDHMMPGMTGVELARIVRGMRPDMPVLLVSGYAEEDSLGADLPRLTKPFRADELAACLDQL